MDGVIVYNHDPEPFDDDTQVILNPEMTCEQIAATLLVVYGVEMCADVARVMLRRVQIARMMQR